jgi:hypothetical protein
MRHFNYFKYIIGGLIGTGLLATTSAFAFIPGYFQLSQAATVGSSTNIAAQCVSATAGQTITFSMFQNGTTTVLPASNNTAAADGSFNATISIPTNIQAGPADLIVACPNGTSINMLVIVEPMLVNGAIIKGSGQTVYLINGGRKFGIPSIDVFNRLGLNFSNLIVLQDYLVAGYPDGGVQN